MRIPDPIANTTTEAYLAYKAGVLSEGDLKPKLYDPYIHLDAWLAYWAGLTKEYPVKNVGKNLFNKNTTTDGYRIGSDGKPYAHTPYTLSWYIPVKPNTTYTISFGSVLSDPSYTNIASYGPDKTFIYRWVPAQVGSYTFTTQADAQYLRVATPLNRKDTTQCELGSTATAYEQYSGEPEMLTDEEALIAYLSGVTNTYPEEFRDPADVRVAAYLKYLVSARFGRPEYPVTNEELYLSMMDAPYIPAGEPSSDIEIDDTAEAPFKDVKMYGDTSQQTYTGKNMIGFPEANISADSLTLKFDADGTITVNGTRSGTSLTDYNVGTLFNFKEGSIALGVSIISGSFSGAAVGIQGINNNSSQTFFMGYRSDGTYVGATSLTQQTISDTTKMKFIIGGGTAVFNNLKFRMQVVAGTTHDTDFEPYVGGTASPNPDYPQAVQTVTGENVVQICGKNLFDKSSATLGKRIAQGGGLYDSADGFTSDFISANENTIYVVNYAVASYLQRICFYDSSKTRISHVDSGSSFTTPANTMYIRICAAQTILDSAQLEKGSTATAYEPYQSQSYEVNLGKNLIDMSQTWVRGTLNNTTVEVQPNDNTILSDYIKVEPNTTYVFSQKQLGGKEVKPNIVSFFKDKVSVRTGLEQVLNSSPQAFTTRNDTHYIRVGYYNSTGLTLDTWLDYVTDLQLEVGSQATSYAAYFEPTELCKIGDYQDYIYENDGKWYVHKEVGKSVLNGSEPNWATQTSGGLKRYSVNRSDSKSFPSRTSDASLSSHFTPSVTDAVGIFFVAVKTYYFYPDQSIATLGSWKSWLASNNVALYYQLATPTDTEITNEALIDQLNALKNGGSYTGTTYIKVSATDPNLPGLLKVEAYKYD